jgi:hypothetical protein
VSSGAKGLSGLQLETLMGSEGWLNLVTLRPLFLNLLDFKAVMA